MHKTMLQIFVMNIIIIKNNEEKKAKIKAFKWEEAPSKET